MCHALKAEHIVMSTLVAFSRLNSCGADPFAAIGWSRKIHQWQRALTDPFRNSWVC